MLEGYADGAVNGNFKGLLLGVSLVSVDGLEIGTNEGAELGFHSGLEGRELGYFVVSFDGTGDGVSGPSVGLEVGRIITASGISDMHSNDYSPVSFRAEM